MRINNVTNNFYSKANSAPECSGGKFAESLELKKREMDELCAKDVRYFTKQHGNRIT